MSDPASTASLIERDRTAAAAQPFLFDVEAREEVKQLGKFSGEGLHRQDPERYKLIVEAVGAGIPDIRIARQLKVSPNTVAAIRRREFGEIADIKRATAKRLREVALMSIDAYCDALPEIQAKRPESLPIGIGIFIERAQLCDGEATAIIEETKRVDPDQLNAAMQALGAAETGLSSTMKSANRADEILVSAEVSSSET